MRDTRSDLTDVFLLNRYLSDEPEETVLSGEEKLEREVNETAGRIFQKGEKLKIVLLSGRSASGKTTFTKKVCKKLCEMGREARHISLDDFFLGISHLPKNPDGTYNMESIKGLDVALANECFRLLIAEGKADFPTFDFPNQKRGDIWNRVEVSEGGLIMIEGIHALNPALSENLPKEGIMKIFVEPEAEYKKDGETFFTARDVRFMRRIARDELFRGWCAEKTFAQWKSVLEGEKIYIEPYIPSAEMTVDTSMDFEPAVFRKTISEMLSAIGVESPFFGEAKAFFEKITVFREIKKDFLPKDSLLREFLG